MALHVFAEYVVDLDGGKAGRRWLYASASSVFCRKGGPYRRTGRPRSWPGPRVGRSILTASHLSPTHVGLRERRHLDPGSQSPRVRQARTTLTTRSRRWENFPSSASAPA